MFGNCANFTQFLAIISAIKELPKVANDFDVLARSGLLKCDRRGLLFEAHPLEHLHQPKLVSLYACKVIFVGDLSIRRRWLCRALSYDDGSTNPPLAGERDYESAAWPRG